MVHAEVQVIAHLVQKGSDGVAPYLGTSAKPCFLCHQFAKESQFQTQDPDYNQYSIWKTPEIVGLSSSKVEDFVQATCAVAGSLKAEVLTPTRSV
jgi:OTT_1508-like deaminase